MWLYVPRYCGYRGMAVSLTVGCMCFCISVSWIYNTGASHSMSLYPRCRAATVSAPSILIMVL
jgi:hypothetical protein